MFIRIALFTGPSIHPNAYEDVAVVASSRRSVAEAITLAQGRAKALLRCPAVRSVRVEVVR